MNNMTYRKFKKSFPALLLAAALVGTACPAGTAFATEDSASELLSEEAAAEEGMTDEEVENAEDAAAAAAAENGDTDSAAADKPRLTSADVPGTIADGISIEGSNVSGQDFDGAMAAAESYAEQFSDVSFTIRAGEKSVTATGADLGIGADAEEVCRRAVNYGKTGNPLERYIAASRCAAGETVDFSIPLEGDFSRISDFLTSSEDDLTDAVVNNGLTRENGRFVFTPGKAGTGIDVSASAAKIVDFIDSDWDGSDASVDLDVEEVEPKGDEEQLKAVQDPLGTFSTNYSTSSASRKTNIRVGTGNINGTVLYPGDEFSASKTMKSRNAENGYQKAGSYENGTTVETYGGGVCQISSTLYNAVIRAELEIIERNPHSFAVSYVSPSDDAAIAEGLKDFVFKNNQDYPVYIEGIANGSTVTFTVYGKETRPAGRKISFESEILETKEPGVSFKPDATLPVGTVSKTTGAHTGYKARLWKIVTENGVEKSRDVFNTSSYRSSDAVYAVGTQGATAEGSAAISAAIATGDVNAVKAAAATAAAEAAKPAEPTPETPAENGGNQTPAAPQTPENNSQSNQGGQGAGGQQTPSSGENPGAGEEPAAAGGQ